MVIVVVEGELVITPISCALAVSSNDSWKLSLYSSNISAVAAILIDRIILLDPNVTSVGVIE